MCARFVAVEPLEELVDLLDIEILGARLPSLSFNVAPTDSVPLVVAAARDGGSRRVEAARWGLVPRWARSARTGVSAINARIETVRERPFFREAVRRRRGVIPATAYYEWQALGTRRVPHCLRATDDAPLLFAALYEWWRAPAAEGVDSGDWLLSTTILTRPAAGVTAGVHARMPLILPQALCADWLDDRSPVPALLDEALSSSQTALRAYEVSAAVGDVRAEGPELILPSSPDGAARGGA